MLSIFIILWPVPLLCWTWSTGQTARRKKNKRNFHSSNIKKDKRLICWLWIRHTVVPLSSLSANLSGHRKLTVSWWYRTSGWHLSLELKKSLTQGKKERQIPVIQPLSLAVPSLTPWYVHRIVYFTFKWLVKTTKRTWDLSNEYTPTSACKVKWNIGI